jgi:hypothetical protein
MLLFSLARQGHDAAFRREQWMTLIMFLFPQFLLIRIVLYGRVGARSSERAVQRLRGKEKEEDKV